MKTSNFLRSAIILAACAVIITAAAACFTDDESPAETEQERISAMAINNVVELEVMRTRFNQLEAANQALADRVAQLEDENRELTHRVAELETTAAVAAATGAVPVAPSMPDQSTASADDRQLVRDFAECTLRMAGEVPENMVSVMADQLSRQMWQEIEDGTTTVVQLRMGYAMLCGSQ